MSWTDERINTAVSAWGEGKSASEIAKTLGGVSRNAVIGLLHRMGFKRDGAAVLGVRNVNVRRQRATLSTVPKPPAAPKPPRPIALAPDPSPPPAEPRPPRVVANASLFDGPGGKPWTERRFGECAAPVGGDGANVRSCCAPVSTNAHGEPSAYFRFFINITAIHTYIHIFHYHKR